jgi:hypothetical protein
VDPLTKGTKNGSQLAKGRAQRNTYTKTQEEVKGAALKAPSRVKRKTAEEKSALRQLKAEKMDNSCSFFLHDLDYLPQGFRAYPACP